MISTTYDHNQHIATTVFAEEWTWAEFFQYREDEGFANSRNTHYYLMDFTHSQMSVQSDTLYYIQSLMNSPAPQDTLRAVYIITPHMRTIVNMFIRQVMPIIGLPFSLEVVANREEAYAAIAASDEMSHPHLK